MFIQWNAACQWKEWTTRTCINMDESHKQGWTKKASFRRIQTPGFYECKFWKQAKLNSMFLRVTHICGTSRKKSKGITNTEFRIVLTAMAERWSIIRSKDTGNIPFCKLGGEKRSVLHFSLLCLLFACVFHNKNEG